MLRFAPTLYHSPFQIANALFDMNDTECSASYHATDIIDAGDKIVLEIELPGYKKEDISVSLQTKYLTISAKPSAPAEEGEAEKNYLRRERCLGEFSCTYTVKDIEEADVEASYENGILTVSLPKKQPVMPEARQFTVQ